MIDFISQDIHLQPLGLASRYIARNGVPASFSTIHVNWIAQDGVGVACTSFVAESPPPQLGANLDPSYEVQTEYVYTLLLRMAFQLGLAAGREAVATNSLAGEEAAN